MPREPRIAVLMISLVVGLLLLQMAYGVTHQLQDVPLSTDLIQSTLRIVVDVFTNHVIFERLYNLFIIFTCLEVLYLCIQQGILRFRLERRIQSQFDKEWTDLLNERFMDGKKEIIVIATSAPIAMAYGVVKPKILLSTGILNKLSSEALEAVLLHEIYHCRKRHPLQALILSSVSKAFSFIPIIKSLTNYYAVWTELLADRYAMNRMKDSAPLGKALLTLVHHQTDPVSEIGRNFAPEAINYRLLQILDPHKNLEIPIFKKSTLYISITTFVFMMVLLFIGRCIKATAYF